MNERHFLPPSKTKIGFVLMTQPFLFKSRSGHPRLSHEHSTLVYIIKVAMTGKKSAQPQQQPPSKKCGSGSAVWSSSHRKLGVVDASLVDSIRPTCTFESSGRCIPHLFPSYFWCGFRGHSDSRPACRNVARVLDALDGQLLPV